MLIGGGEESETKNYFFLVFCVFSGRRMTGVSSLLGAHEEGSLSGKVSW